MGGEESNLDQPGAVETLLAAGWTISVDNTRFVDRPWTPEAPDGHTWIQEAR